ncbi:bifunctional deaminase-reductase domain protein [Chthoniobacter flavus Ellin428]|uniref:Bifunctional deaminase-reductase domain protein n=1 Tax=Chthoniobacter flavus Ellin428 TaxID=497964 RepID=B4CYC6_9BACT|nr:dihydrofolate reductase family protein [Chthoniobacter flavus]EDY20467.1 bifunctional deaminase-reductase domain protein [Chthoniobacter flavus Ellin428]
MPRQPPRPFVTSNFAMTWDGRISTRRSTPANFTSPKDKRRLVEIRAECDAILAGAKTIATDNMTMGLPDPALRTARVKRGQSAYPLRVLLTNSGRIDPALRVFESTFSPIIIFSTTRMPARVQSALAGKADLWLHEGPAVNLAGMLATLRADYGVKRLVCEGGAQIFRALLSAGLIDEIHLTLAPKIFGGIKATTITGIAGDFLPKSINAHLRSMEVIEDECFLRYRIRVAEKQ